jgi:hypothetical protein
MAITKRSLDKATQAEQDLGPRVTGARYLRTTSRIEVTYDSGVTVTAPIALIQDLATLETPATAAQLAKIEVSPDGRYIDWPKIDVSIYAPAFMRHILGNRAWMAEHARGMGSAKSEAKAAAARENGKKGGRPRKTQPPAHVPA